VAFCTFIGGTVAVYAYLTSKLPSTNAMAERQRFQSTFIYARDGTLLNEVMDPNGGRRLVVDLKDISKYLVNATVATEDPTFFTNPGIDTTAEIRAFYQNMTSPEIASGASTITMQLVRNVMFTDEERFERSMTRKIKESLLAYQVSMRFTKEEILGMYLNEIPYGNMYYGAEAAAQGYFGKSAADLTLGQASLLAGLPQSPGDYNP
jgi:membrane peptidoglycan carboxypeptidase